MKIALAHDYLIQMGGAERVVAAMHRHFPTAPIYTSAVARKTLWSDFANADIRTSWMQHLPGIQHPVHFKKYFALYPSAFRSFGEIQADCVWISASTFAKFLRVTPGTRTVCYLHNTSRPLWQTDEYVDYEVKSRFANRLVRASLPALRAMDRKAAARMDVLVANSLNVQRRILDHYGLPSVVIPPPVSTSRFQVSTSEEGFYLIVSRLLGYKNIDLAVRAFSQTGRPLVVLGDGPFRKDLEKLAGPSVRILGRLSDKEITSYFARCRGFVFPGNEDFGITPVEAMACGKPVVAYKRGGALETVIEGKSGVFFEHLTPECLLEAVNRLETTTWNPHEIRRHAEQFSEERFLERMHAVITERNGASDPKAPVQ